MNTINPLNDAAENPICDKTKVVLPYRVSINFDTTEGDSGQLEFFDDQAKEILADLYYRKAATYQKNILKPLNTQKLETQTVVNLNTSVQVETLNNIKSDLSTEFKNIFSKRQKDGSEGATIILFNAPPSAGKDLSCELLKDSLNNEFNQYVMFKEILYEKTAELLDIALPIWVNMCQSIKQKDSEIITKMNHLEVIKKTNLSDDLITELFKVKTPREMLIFLAEKVLKPELGVDFIAKHTSQRVIEVIKSGVPLVLIPDLGFDYELSVLKEQIYNSNVQVDQIIVVQIYRDGCDYSKDSRNYVNCDLHPIDEVVNNNQNSFAFEHFKISNNSTIADYHYELLTTLITIISKDKFWKSQDY